MRDHSKHNFLPKQHNEATAISNWPGNSSGGSQKLRRINWKNPAIFSATAEVARISGGGPGSRRTTPGDQNPFLMAAVPTEATPVTRSVARHGGWVPSTPSDLSVSPARRD
ncbi:uncharacterized protein LOC110268015 [Arachis ipaensis]|uniref:uncharacterized protein LOC110268015 n=1 Tax=Arachis ipaensis TaxID=130454 RepID=UPI000A2B68AE|nr:uncharacterized protein LOC110268015 [Arachis ipaensis]